MKTTIELPDDLLTQAKAVAAERRTSLKAMMEHALRRELMDLGDARAPDVLTEQNEYGFPVLRKREDGDVQVTSELIYRMLEEE